MAASQSHKLEVNGSSPFPATNHQNGKYCLNVGITILH